MIYRISLLMSIFACVTSSADTSLYIEGEDADVAKYVTVHEVYLENSAYISFGFNQQALSEFVNYNCVVSASMKILLDDSRSFSVSLFDIEASSVGKQRIEVNDFEVDAPITIALRFGNVPDSCSERTDFRKLYGIYFELDSVRALVNSVNLLG